MAHPLTTFHLFAGAGGGILADLLLGHTPVGACEIEPYPRNVLLQRQRDGALPSFPVWDDINTLDGTPWRGSVDVLAGGFPCQDISSAGKGAGISGERSGLWKEYARLIGEMRPRFVFAENSPLLRTRGLGVVLEDLASLGYNARWGIIGARDVGAPHKRERIWIVAESRSKRTPRRKGWGEDAGDASSPSADVADRHGVGLEGCGAGPSTRNRQIQGEFVRSGGTAWWESDPAEREGDETEPNVGRVAHGVAARVDRLKAIGNGQVPAVAALAWKILSEDLLTQ